jgi:hypothetical protein
MRYILGSIEWAGVVRILQYLGLRPKQHTAPPDSPSIAVIGNGPISPAGVRFIDDYSIVVRFNQCLHFRTYGTKTNILVFSNSGYSGDRLARDPSYIQPEALESAGEIWLVRPSDILAERLAAAPPEEQEFYRDYTRDIIEKLVGKKHYYVFSRAEYERVERTLMSRGARNFAMPSSGILAIDRLLDIYPDHKIDLYGFNHTGWPFHPWRAEKKFVDKLERVTRY